MNKSFENYIQQNREAFDTQNPDPGVVEKMQQRLRKQSKQKTRIIAIQPLRWLAAAAIIGIVVSGVLLFRSSTDQAMQTSAIMPPATEAAIQRPEPIAQENIMAGVNVKHRTIPLLDETLTEQKRQILSQISNTESASERLSSVLVATELKNTDKEIIDVLVKTMNNDSNSNVRVAALEALQNFCQEPYVKLQLINALASQKDPFVQIKLIEILTKTRERSVINTLNKIIKNHLTIDVVKEQAVIGLNKMSL